MQIISPLFTHKGQWICSTESFTKSPIEPFGTDAIKESYYKPKPMTKRKMLDPGAFDWKQ